MTSKGDPPTTKPTKTTLTRVSNRATQPGLVGPLSLLELRLPQSGRSRAGPHPPAWSPSSLAPKFEKKSAPGNPCPPDLRRDLRFPAGRRARSGENVRRHSSLPPRPCFGWGLCYIVPRNTPPLPRNNRFKSPNENPFQTPYLRAEDAF